MVTAEDIGCVPVFASLDESALPAQSQFWQTALAHTPLSADAIHQFDVSDLGVVSHVRFNLHPDGGVSRLRLWGLPSGEAI